MKQKICLPLFASISLLTIPVASQAALGTVQSGFFVGLAADVINTSYGYKDVTSTSIKQTSTATVFGPDMSVGYGSLVSSNNLYVAFDVGGQLGNNKTIELAYYNSPSTVTNNGSQGMAYYADFMPGLVFNNQSSVFYGIIGAADGRFTLKQQNNGSNDFSLTDSHFGYRIGVGYLLALTNSFSVNAKVVYSNFGSISYDHGTDQYQLNPKVAQLSLGVNYTFGGDNASTQSPFLGD